MTSGSWLRTKEIFGKRLLAGSDREDLLLEQGITALHESLEREET